MKMTFDSHFSLSIIFYKVKNIVQKYSLQSQIHTVQNQIYGTPKTALLKKNDIIENSRKKYFSKNGEQIDL